LFAVIFSDHLLHRVKKKPVETQQYFVSIQQASLPRKVNGEIESKAN